MLKNLNLWVQRYFSDPEALSILGLALLIIIAINTMGYVIAPLLASLIISYMLAGIVNLLVKFHWPRLLAVIVVFIAFLAVMTLIIIWLVPLLWIEVNNLIGTFPSVVGKLQELLLKFQSQYPILISRERLNQFFSSGWEHNLEGMGRVIWTFSIASVNRVLTMAIYLVLVPLLVFFFLKDGQVIGNWCAGFFPKKHSKLQLIWREIHAKIGSYIKGKFLEMLIVFAATAIAFALLGLQYTILLSALVALSVIVPYIGIIIATIPLVVVGLWEWGWTLHFLNLMIIYVVIVALDAHILAPVLFGGMMDLHPLAIILGVLVFGTLWGFWGIFFAIPLVALLQVLLKSWPTAHTG